VSQPLVGEACNVEEQLQNNCATTFGPGVTHLGKWYVEFAFCGSKEYFREIRAMWHFLFLAFQWQRGKRGFVILSLALLAFLLYAIAHVR
jgi:hypothetical protein